VERPVKERLVGAAVLMAAAVILIPEMLSGPKHKTETAATNQNDGPYKTYTIDLSRSPGVPAAVPMPQQVSEAAPPPEEVTPPVTETTVADGGSPSATSSAGTQASPESASPEPVTPPPARVASTPATPTSPPARQQTSPSEREPASSPAASTPSVPTQKGWAVQLGSFSSRATAERMVKDLSGSGLTAFVMPVKSGANTLYRVRVGPFAERAAANAALAGIKKRVANAAVVAHP
jgi:DedD protein